MCTVVCDLACGARFRRMLRRPQRLVSFIVWLRELLLKFNDMRTLATQRPFFAV